MARRVRRRSRRGSSGSMAAGVVLILCFVAILGAGFYIFYETRSSHVAVDDTTHCPKSPASVTAIIIDATNRLSAPQHLDLMNRIEALISEIPRYGMLAIYAVGSKGTSPEPVFLRCNPGRAEELSGWTANPVMVEREWQNGFREPLDTVLEQVLESSEASRSPIMESIQWVTLNTLDTPNYADISRRLVIASDLIQHTDGVSFYRNTANFRNFSKTRYFHRVSAPLQGVDVDLLFFRRNVGIPDTVLYDFWRDYFGTLSVESIRIVNLSG